MPLFIAFSQYAPSKSNPKALSTLPLHKVVYVLCNLLTLGVGLWKCRSMGLLPTGTGDWLAFETRGPVSTLSRDPSGFELKSLYQTNSRRRFRYSEASFVTSFC